MLVWGCCCSSLSRELRTASSRGRYGERRQRDPCLKHTYKNTTCWPATAYDVTTGANHSIKGRRENTSSSSSSSMTVLFEAFSLSGAVTVASCSPGWSSQHCSPHHRGSPMSMPLPSERLSSLSC